MTKTEALHILIALKKGSKERPSKLFDEMLCDIAETQAYENAVAIVKDIETEDYNPIHEAISLLKDCVEPDENHPFKTVIAGARGDKIREFIRRCE